MGRHVVGDDVQDHAHVPTPKLPGESLELHGGADFGVEPGGVDEVVAVAASGAGSKEGRGIEGGDA